MSILRKEHRQGSLVFGFEAYMVMLIKQYCMMISIVEGDCLEELKRVAGRYVEAMESMKREREELKRVIVKYIIASGDLAECTESAISNNLGLPRSIVRSILSELVEEGILVVREIGNTKPYTLSEVGVGAALDWLNLSFTREEINEILRVKEREGEEKPGQFAAGITTRVGGKTITRYREVHADKCLTTLVGRFLRLLGEERENVVREKLKEAFPKQTMDELRLLFPEFYLFKELLEALNPLNLPWLAWDEFRGVTEETTAQEVRRVVVEAFERGLSHILARYKRFFDLLEAKGYEGVHEHFRGKWPYIQILVRGKEPEFRFHDEYVWASTLALREICKIGEKIGADPKLLKEAKLLADVLDMAVEKKYMGIEREGAGLIEWALKDREA
ncbi:hypothetical protein DRO58_09260 [Candidatus Bathyarchaeota archaeon]|nr:MAG: hypothetical protein DRO58_09260 [Candidatus Bathyarchaeota archaeon]